MNNEPDEKPEGIQGANEHKEAQLLMSLWQAEVSPLRPVPVSTKTKATLQDLLRSHGITHMPAIDAMQVYDSPNPSPAAPAPSAGRATLPELMAALRDGAAIAARGVRDFMQAMQAPRPALLGSALRLAPVQEAGDAVQASHEPVQQSEALDWHVAAMSFRPSDRQVTLVIRTHLAASDARHVAVLGWSGSAVAQVVHAEADDREWALQPDDVVLLWEGDLASDQHERRIAFRMPEGCELDHGFEAVRTLLVDDGAGAWVISLKLSELGR